MGEGWSLRTPARPGKLPRPGAAGSSDSRQEGALPLTCRTWTTAASPDHAVRQERVCQHQSAAEGGTRPRSYTEGWALTAVSTWPATWLAARTELGQ